MDRVRVLRPYFTLSLQTCFCCRVFDCGLYIMISYDGLNECNHYNN